MQKKRKLLSQKCRRRRCLWKFLWDIFFFFFVQCLSQQKSAQQGCGMWLASSFVSFNLNCLSGTINELHESLCSARNGFFQSRREIESTKSISAAFIRSFIAITTDSISAWTVSEGWHQFTPCSQTNVNFISINVPVENDNEVPGWCCQCPRSTWDSVESVFSWIVTKYLFIMIIIQWCVYHSKKQQVWENPTQKCPQLTLADRLP